MLSITETGIKCEYEVTCPEASRHLLKKGPLNIVDVLMPLKIVDGEQIGNLCFTSEMKLELSSLSEDPDSPIIIMTGKFKEQRFMIVKKFPKSRKQGLIGECKGKNQVKKAIGYETSWLTTLSLDKAEASNPLVVAGLAMIVSMGGI